MSKEYDITNVLEKIKSKDITYSDVNFNLIPEIILHYQNILVPEKKFDNPFKKNFKWELTTLVFKFLVIMKKHNHDNLEVVEYLIKKIKDEKNLDRNDFDNLLKEVKIFVKTYNERTDIVNELLENNFGNAEILTAIKKTIDEGSFLNKSHERYFLFCTLDYQKNKIHESGEVPIGWLPSDLIELINFANQKMGKLSQNQKNSNLLNVFLHWSDNRF